MSLTFPSDDEVRRREQAAVSLRRLLPRLEAEVGAAADPSAWQTFIARLQSYFPRLFSQLVQLYGTQYDFFYHLEMLLHLTARMWLARPADLRELDAQREAEPDWFQSQAMMGGVLYVDLFAGNLSGVREAIPYFEELGLTYLHLMPLFAVPQGNNDGGYAVSDYRRVRPDLGSMEELSHLAAEMRSHGISLVLDFVLNHTSNEHDWAERARSGDGEYRDFYFTFPDRTVPDRYDAALREIFPDVRRGNFSFDLGLRRWVWTTFHDFQWDLNYSNPEVFNRMTGEMLQLANIGAEVLRFDALAFIWKRMGTPSESLPEAHLVIKAFNTIARIAAPSLLFKSEAIVHPSEVMQYVGSDQCQLSYNPLLMALLWEALATREVRLLQRSMREHFALPKGCAWVNYVRSHDDIGWTFDDADAARLGINGYDHRQFLNAFYTGRFPGSFARGLPFGENPRTGDARVAGTAASLCGLERAVGDGDPHEIALSVDRLLLLYSIVLSIGGIPLLYLGDEVATLNDYTFRADAEKAEDSRWVHRTAAVRHGAYGSRDESTPGGKVFSRLTCLIRLRKSCDALAGTDMLVVESGNPHVFAYSRTHAGARFLACANLSEAKQTVAGAALQIYGPIESLHDVVRGDQVDPERDLVLEPYQFVWLVPD